jgi:S1-C subfamily serine protease
VDAASGVGGGAGAGAGAGVGAVPDRPPARPRWRAFATRHTTALTALAAAFVASIVTLWAAHGGPAPQRLTQKHIDEAVRHALEKEPLPSPYARASAAIAPSVVRVTGFGENEEPDAAVENPGQRAMDRSLGTGVVIVDNGTILTNLHVVAGSKRIMVRFADGHESPADVVGTQPENDLAVLRATSLPDDLKPATMRSTGDLLPGDQVVAVGHPFGIGPSTSGGVISGLRREFREPNGEKVMTNLIQFDAAANPGNSGGPLVTMDGHVVGIVTAILNPTDAKTFIGIGFAVPIENAASAVGMPPF